MILIVSLTFHLLFGLEYKTKKMTIKPRPYEIYILCVIPAKESRSWIAIKTKMAVDSNANTYVMCGV